MQGKKLGKAVYVFSVDAEGGKVAHANYLPEASRPHGFDAKIWASKVTEVLGGKVRQGSSSHSEIAHVQYRPEAKKRAPKALVST